MIIECRHSHIRRTSWLVVRFLLAAISNWNVTATHSVHADKDMMAIGMPKSDRVVTKIDIHVLLTNIS